MKHSNKYRLDNPAFTLSKKATAISLAILSISVSSATFAKDKQELQLINKEPVAVVKVLESQSKLRAISPARAIKDQYIVVFKDQFVTAQVEGMSGVQTLSQSANMNYRRQVVQNASNDIANLYGAKVVQKYHAALAGMVVKMNAANMKKLLADNRIDFIEQDQIMQASATQFNPTWGLDRIDQASLPLDSKYNYDTDGTGVRAYIIDTGILSSHSDFNGRVSGGFSAINDGNGTGDCNGHGTHVAGTVGSTTYGVAKKVSLVPVRVLDCAGSGSNSGVIAGVDWVAQNGIRPAVANMSLGGGSSTALDNSVKNAISKGITFVVAAGNSNSDACSGSPNRVANALTIAASTSSDARSSFSSWGSCIDLFAPGSSIKSTWSNGGTNTIGGTSMASPHVAGAVALYLQSNSNASTTQVMNAIKSNAVSGKISNANGSPNLLLQTQPGSGGGGNLEPIDATVPNISVAKNAWARYTLSLDSGYSSLTVTISGGTGDADLYVTHGSQSTTSSYDCRPYKNGNNETCTFNSPASGTWHIDIHGFTAASGITLNAKANP